MRGGSRLAACLGCALCCALVPVPGAGQGLVPEEPSAYRSFPRVPGYRAFLPPSRDISGGFPRPRDQGRQTSCVAWAVGYALRSYYERLNRDWDLADEHHLFSPAFLYNRLLADNARARDSCMAGTRISDALNLLRHDGIASLADFPYDPRRCSVLPDTQVETQAQSFRIEDWRAIDTSSAGALDDIKGQIARGDPVVFGMNVPLQFHTLKADEVFDDIQSNPRFGHAMVIVGYSEARQAFRIMNSWGTDWADNGFGWVSYRAFRELSQQAFVVRMSEVRASPGLLARTGAEPVPPPPAPAAPPPSKAPEPLLPLPASPPATFPELKPVTIARAEPPPAAPPPPVTASTAPVPVTPSVPAPQAEVAPALRPVPPPPVQAVVPPAAPAPAAVPPTLATTTPPPVKPTSAPASTPDKPPGVVTPPVQISALPPAAPLPPQREAAKIPETTATIRQSLLAYQCARLDLADAPDARPVLSGFVASEADLDQLRNELLQHGGGRIDTSAVEVAPWPLCETLLTLETPLSDSGGLSVSIGGQAAARSVLLSEGEPLAVEVETPDFPSYLYVTYVDSGGDAIQLYAPPAVLSRALPPHTRMTLGAGEGQPSYRVGPPFGREMVVAVASASPLFDQDRPASETERQYLTEFRAAYLARSASGKSGRRVAASVARLTTRMQPVKASAP